VDVAGFVGKLEAVGLRLWEDSGRLRFRGPQGAMTAERRQLLQANKDAVLEYLRASAGNVEVAHDPHGRYDPFPLTDVQAAYLLGRRDVFVYGGVACHAYGELVFGELDPSRMQAAWRRLIRRHDMLRAVVDYDGFQRVLDTVPDYEIAVADLRGAPPAEAAASLAKTRGEMDHDVHQPDRWPLFGLRITLLDGQAILHVSIDFLIADYISIYLLLDELRDLYQAPGTVLPAVPISFRDYLLAEHKLRQGPRYERSREYWLSRLDDLPAAPELPLLSDPHSGSGRFRRLQAVLGERAWQALKVQAASRGVTASGAVLAAYAEVIARWSRQPRFTLDLTLLSRLPLHPAVGRVVGDFTSVELLAVDRREGGTFTERATALGGRLFEDLDHRLFSGVAVLREIARQRGQDAALMPVVFTSAIGLRADVPDKAPLGELGDGISQTPQVWIDCQAMENGGTMSVNWDIREGVLPDGLADDMFEAFASLLNRLAAEPTTWDQAEVVALPAAQLERREQANDTSGPLPDVLLHEGILHAALDDPQGIAVISGGTAYRYADLTGSATAVAGALKAAGVQPGDLLAVVMDKGWAQIVGVLGVLLADGAYLPIDTHQPASRRDQILADAGVRHVLTHSAAPAGWPDGVAVLAVDEIEPVSAPAGLPSRLRDPADPAYVIYTSGSTGDPKGVMISHRAAVNTISDINSRFAVTPADLVLGLANLGFDLSVYDIFGVLAAGGTLVLPDPGLRADPSHWAALIGEHGVTLWNTVPAQLHMLNEYLRTANDDLSSLRLAMLSGDWIPVSLPGQIRSRLPGLSVVSLGGATEASIWSIWYPIDEVDPAWPSIPYGKPLTNQRFHVLDALGQDSPDWVPGKLLISGEGVALGYLGDPQRTAARFVTLPGTGERAYLTGDIGRYLPDGTIEFLGRDDRQVKIRGYRIELAEVEAALQADPAVAAAAALAAGAAPLERRLLAFVEPARVEPRPLPGAASLAAEVEAAGAQIRTAGDAGRVVEFARQLDQTALTVMADVLRQHGLFGTPGDWHTTADIMTAARVAAKHHRLVRRWLAALVRERYLDQDSTGRYRLLRTVEPGDVVAAWQRVEKLLPDAQDRPELVHYFQVAARHLPQLMRDEQDPVQLLFPEGSVDIQEAAYGEGFLSRYLNRLTTGVLRAIAARREAAGPLRVLEVGAGVGGTSVEVIPALADLDVRYLFTDVSQFFLNRGGEQFAEYPWVHYALFDMNEPYRDQGLTPNSFDVVLAGNVMHYSRNADTVLARMRELLVPGGWLVFIETTRDNYQILTSMEFLFDATAGDFQDVRHGKDQTFIGREQWLGLLRAAGAETVLCLPGPGDELASIGMHVFAARFKADRVLLEEAGVSSRLAQRVPAEMVPAQIQVVDDLPLTENGKVDRRTLDSWVLPDSGRPGGRAAADGPMSDLEQQVSAIWAAVLHTSHAGRQDNFYELGGDSLLAAQVVTEIREQVPGGQDVYFDELLRELLNTATVAGLAALLGGQEVPEEAGGGLALAGDPAALPVLVLVGGDIAGEDTRLTQRHAVITTAPFDPGPADGIDPLTRLQRLGGDLAAEVKLLSAGPFHVVGTHHGAVLAVEIASRLTESGAEVTGLTAIGPGPASIGDRPLEPYVGDVTLLLSASDVTAGGDPVGGIVSSWRDACLGELRVRVMPDGHDGADAHGELLEQVLADKGESR